MQNPTPLSPNFFSHTHVSSDILTHIRMKFLLFLTLLASPLLAVVTPTIIPLPAEITSGEGILTIGSSFAINTSKINEPEAKKLEAIIKNEWKTNGKTQTLITLTDDPKLLAQHGHEAYQLTIEANSININAASNSAHFYAIQTLRQLAHTDPKFTRIPHLIITDYPRFAYRGLMLDEARHFMGKKYVKHLLRAMAAHKLNRFHWHLTDDQAWRIEIKAYPNLTKIGATRGEGTKIPTPDWDKTKKTDPNGPPYSGHYTQEDIKEIVAYAKTLHIEILPEIDLPGHSFAFGAAYPETLPKTDQDTGKGVHGYSNNVLSVVREENYKMLDTIFGEITEIFPYPYIHVGGDEVNVNAWKASPEHRDFMRENGFNDPHQLQNMFMIRLEKILKTHKRTMMGWNEIMHGGNLTTDTGVMAWINLNAGISAAKKGHPTILAPGPHCYFDMKYPGHSETGHWWAGIVSTEKAYNWNPLLPEQLTPEQQKNILGIQCALWTAFVPTPKIADYRLFPRACATAEVAWTPQAKRDYDNFNTRLGTHLNFLDLLNVNYRVAPPKAELINEKISLIPPYPGAEIIYTTDNTDPTKGIAKTYTPENPIPSTPETKLRYRHIRPNGKISKTENQLQDENTYLQPAMRYQTNIGKYHAKNSPGKAGDWDRKTFFWHADTPKQGDFYTLTPKQPIPIESITWQTGHPNSGKDIAQNAVLETSTDGKTYTNRTPFKNGTATLTLPKPTLITHMRITLTKPQTTWLIIQDPKLK